MRKRTDVWQGTIALMALNTLQSTGVGARIRHRAPHRADERDRAEVKYGTPYLVLLRLEQGGNIMAHWGVSASHREARRFYELTRAGRKMVMPVMSNHETPHPPRTTEQVERQAQQWELTTNIVASFLRLKEE